MNADVFPIGLLIIVLLAIIAGQVYLYFARKIEKKIDEAIDDETKNDFRAE